MKTERLAFEFTERKVGDGSSDVNLQLIRRSAVRAKSEQRGFNYFTTFSKTLYSVYNQDKLNS